MDLQRKDREGEKKRGLGDGGLSWWARGKRASSGN